MKIKNLIYIIAFGILMTSCSSSKKRDQTISLSGAFALYPLVITWAEEYKKENPGIRFNISGGGAGKGMADALSGAVDLGMFSRGITQAEINLGVWWVGSTIDAVLPTINENNPYLDILKERGLTRDEFRGIFIDGTIKNWSDLQGISENKEIKVFTRSDACGAAETWAEYLGGHQENLQGIGIFGDPGLAEAIAKEPQGIGFNNTIFIYDIKTGKKRPGLEVAPLDINGNGKIDPDEDNYDTFDAILEAIAQGLYPSPPSRELYLVSKGIPEKESVVDFLRWTLTEGQKFVKEAGYVPLAQEKIDYYLEKLN